MTERAERWILLLWLCGGALLAVQLLVTTRIIGRLAGAVADFVTMVQQARPRQDSLLAAVAAREQRRDSLLVSSNTASQLLLEIQCAAFVRDGTRRVASRRVIARCDSLTR